MVDSLQTDAPLEHMNLQPSTRQMNYFTMLRDDGFLVLDAPYQRGSVWSTNQRRNLFRSFMQGVPVPAIIANDRFKANRELDAVAPIVVIDGKQRIEAMLAWRDGELDLPASWFEPELVESTHDTDDGPYVYREELTAVGRRFIDSRAILPVSECAVKTVAEEARIFGLVNGGGVVQDEATMERAARIAADESVARHEHDGECDDTLCKTCGCCAVSDGSDCRIASLPKDTLCPNVDCGCGGQGR